MSYESITVGDSNPIKRWVQRRRYYHALRLWKKPQLNEQVQVLDYGGGNGGFLRQLADTPAVRATLYEPTASLMAEAKQMLFGREFVRFTECVTDLGDETYDFVFCLEVFEHLPEKETEQALAVIGVPVEIYFPALVKGLFRVSRRYGEFDATQANVFAAMLGQAPSKRPTARITPGFNYHFHHLGFDFRHLQRQIAEMFTIKKRWFSPVPFFAGALNSEVYFLLQKARQDSR